MTLKDLVKVGVVVRNKLRRYAHKNMHWCVVFANDVQIRVSLLLGKSQGLAGPHLVDDASGLCAKPGTAAITLAIEFKLLGTVPYA